MPQMKCPPRGEGISAFAIEALQVLLRDCYFGGAGVKISRRAGSGFGLGFGAFLASFLPLSLLPMVKSMTQTAARGKSKSLKYTAGEHRPSGRKGKLARALFLGSSSLEEA
jgi:hypothetical protein